MERSRRAVSEKVREIVTVGPLEVFTPSGDNSDDQDGASSSSSNSGWVMSGIACTAFIAYIAYQKRDHFVTPNEVNPEVL